MTEALSANQLVERTFVGTIGSKIDLVAVGGSKPQFRHSVVGNLLEIEIPETITQSAQGYSIESVMKISDHNRIIFDWKACWGDDYCKFFLLRTFSNNPSQLEMEMDGSIYKFTSNNGWGDAHLCVVVAKNDLRVYFNGKAIVTSSLNLTTPIPTITSNVLHMAVENLDLTSELRLWLGEMNMDRISRNANDPQAAGVTQAINASTFVTFGICRRRRMPGWQVLPRWL